jgi:predicted lipoprotein with Yx(FWY)xxD motif
MRKLYLFAALAAISLVLAACSNSSTSTPPAGGGTTTSSSATSPSGGSTGSATVQTAQIANFGMILTDAQGHALYLYQQDSGTTSACTSVCASTWPPLTVTGRPTAGNGVTASLLGTAKQADGSMQVTYNGHLLYGFTGDSAAGTATGEGLEGFVLVSAAGDPVTQPMGGGSSSSSGYHY